MTQLTHASVQWVSPSSAAQAIVQERLESSIETAEAWQHSADGARQWWSRELRELAHGQERWIVVRTRDGEGPGWWSPLR